MQMETLEAAVLVYFWRCCLGTSRPGRWCMAGGVKIREAAPDTLPANHTLQVLVNANGAADPDGLAALRSALAGSGPGSQQGQDAEAAAWQVRPCWVAQVGGRQAVNCTMVCYAGCCHRRVCMIDKQWAPAVPECALTRQRCRLPPPTPQALAAACWEELARLPTSTDEDEALLRQAAPHQLAQRARLAVEFRLEKKRLLRRCAENCAARVQAGTAAGEG